MEQTNLVVTPDGKTWDEVTRDVSYIGKMHKVIAQEDADTTFAGNVVFTAWRGHEGDQHRQNKDFAIAYDRLICLKDGQYRIEWMVSASDHAYVGGNLQINAGGVFSSQWEDTSQGRSSLNQQGTVTLKRGDTLQCIFHGVIEGSSVSYNNLTITEVN